LAKKKQKYNFLSDFAKMSDDFFEHNAHKKLQISAKNK